MVKIDFVNEQEPAINDTNLNQMQLNIENAINAQVAGDTLPVGAIVPFGSNVIPENWLLCDGSAISRTEYALLFSIIGTTYGQGDGSTTFNIPNLPDTDYYNIIKSKSSAGVVATVVDNLTSTSSTDALSAKQGKVLNDSVTAINNKFVYSSTETVIGTYMDKPLYRKILTEIVPQNGGTNYPIAHNISNLELIIHQELNCTNSSGNTYPQHNDIYDLYIKDTDAQNVWCNISGAFLDWTAIVVLEYTKTTD